MDGRDLTRRKHGPSDDATDGSRCPSSASRVSLNDCHASLMPVNRRVRSPYLTQGSRACYSLLRALGLYHAIDHSCNLFFSTAKSPSWRIQWRESVREAGWKSLASLSKQATSCSVAQAVSPCASPKANHVARAALGMRTSLACGMSGSSNPSSGSL